MQEKSHSYDIYILKFFKIIINENIEALIKHIIIFTLFGIIIEIMIFNKKKNNIISSLCLNLIETIATKRNH